jgi:hypothetical protein
VSEPESASCFWASASAIAEFNLKFRVRVFNLKLDSDSESEGVPKHMPHRRHGANASALPVAVVTCNLNKPKSLKIEDDTMIVLTLVV